MDFSSKFGAIRFIGYAIPTGPVQPTGMIGIGDYLGNSDNQVDFSARLAILKNAVDTAKAALPLNEDPSTVLNVFMAPEFYFHGSIGPYVYEDEQSDPLPNFIEQIKTAFNPSDYPNWMFVCGTLVSAKVANLSNVFNSASVKARNTVINTLTEQLQSAWGANYELISGTIRSFIQGCQDIPNVVVRDRAVVFSNIPIDTPTSLLGANAITTEKYNVSNEDFLLTCTTPNKQIITEQMIGYPRIDLSGGDLKKHAFDSYSIFRQNYGVQNTPQYVDFAVEICLDHDDCRLRSNLGLEPFPKSSDAVHIQLVPSYGSQIVPYAVVADVHGFVFNCDGQSLLTASGGSSGSGAQAGDAFGVQCVYANYSNGTYAAHTQLARVATAAVGNDPNTGSPTFQNLQAVDVKVITLSGSIPSSLDVNTYFAGGIGEVHIYGCETPYLMYPD